MTEPTYTLTQAQYEALHKTRNISNVYEIITSLKPNSQEPDGFVHLFKWKDKQSEQVVKITRNKQPEHGYTNALYTHPAPMSKEDMLKVLAALEAIKHSMQQAQLPGNDRMREIKQSYNTATQTLTSIKHYANASVEKEKPVTAKAESISIEQAHVEGMV